jgi:hypothetical protein
MNNKNTGGQVYPSEQGQDAEGKWNQTYEAGITRRDWLAGLAMQAFIAMYGTGVSAQTRAEWAYAEADALIAEGKRHDEAD